MRDEKQLAGGLVLVCILVALLGGALWLGLSGKRLLGSKLADLLDPVEEHRFSLIAQHRSAGKAEVGDKPTLVMFGFTRCGTPCSETLDIVSRTIVDLGSKADDVSFVFISVDPHNDFAPGHAALSGELSSAHPRPNRVAVRDRHAGLDLLRTANAHGNGLQSAPGSSLPQSGPAEERPSYADGDRFRRTVHRRRKHAPIDLIQNN